MVTTRLPLVFWLLVPVMSDFCAVPIFPFDVNNPLSWPLDNVTVGDAPNLTSAQLNTVVGSEVVQQVADYIVRKHNCLRTRSSPPAGDMMELVWNLEAAQQAQKWANNCTFGHNPGEDRTTSKFACGQNIVASWPTPMSWNSVINIWYNEVNQYVYGDPKTYAAAGHYTQVVWARTLQVGCGYQHCTPMSANAFHFYVCNFCPGGNQEVNGHVGVPYQVGPACSACPNNCDQGQLCG